jgi:hypothetical protein
MGTTPVSCDVCSKPFETSFIDGATRGGPWANMCLRCHREIGAGIGQGQGQLYQRQTDGRWLKTEG